jgi:hypothetical protein
MAIINAQQLEKLKQSTHQVVNRLVDQHITLGVTGLSRSGKTAFITSLVNQLLHGDNHHQLAFFDPVQQQRFIAAKRLPQPHLHIGRFDYEKAMASLASNPPQWPVPTQGISELRLAIRYKIKSSFLKWGTDTATLFVDITDYPGEWLLDLPMLKQNFAQWSEQMLSLMQQSPRNKLAQPFLTRLQQLDPWQPVDEQLLQALASEYTELLHQFRESLGLSLIQPGRFILPGDHKNAPLLQFFPFWGIESLDATRYQQAKEDSLIGMLKARFNEYKERLVKPFYQQHFSKFDRQIVLADCLTPLNNGRESFTDLQQCMALILDNFDYGQSNWLNRLFSPKIDKLLFVATKSDHVTADQHENLVSLLNQLIYPIKQHRAFDLITMNALAISSITVTQQGVSEYQGKKLAVLRGKEAKTGKIITAFPGTVPKILPDENFWQQQQFHFINFLPQQPQAMHQAIPHQRMDLALQFLLADKMS